MTVSTSSSQLCQGLTHDIRLPATDEEDWTNNYAIALKFKDVLEDIAPKWHVNRDPLPAFDMKGRFIKVHNLESLLTGSLVLVYFELKHYAIKSKKTDNIAGNTFSAISTQVKVLEPGTEHRQSPYKSLMLKGPIVLRKIFKKDQTNAAINFNPGFVPPSSCQLSTRAFPLYSTQDLAHR